VVPDACTELYDLFVRGMYDRARELSAGLIRLNHSISGAWGVAGVKAAMDLAGLRGGRPREPLTPVPMEATAQIKQALVNEGFLVTSR
jgi:4-hydroxy-2-oxoglutarate aldolase